ncbi:hypothetical protein TRFO_15109 [Tritrichomonas foetus]|uniref:Viral A-type inclusion protein n=1 Tax=Tritrichomonas foetus TaxID=1144522 RepID=A0A1J4KXM6_9EUKA|nr:hypothetical protein TRFO_15109 [Tritrichomonas foetus]|eukprot:OHT14462.1 hypothetical protein TRFO_15109 [Tritrichomonas foetus]
MSAYSDSDSRFVKIGESVLKQTYEAVQSSDSDTNASTAKDELYFHTTNLSSLLKSNGIENINSQVPDNFDMTEINQAIQTILSDLNVINKMPTADVGPQSVIFEAFRLLTFTFLTLPKVHPNEQFHQSLLNENNILKEKINNIQYHYNNKLKNSTNKICNEVNSLQIQNEKLEKENEKLNSRISDLEQSKDSLLIEKQSQDTSFTPFENSTELVNYLAEDFNLQNADKEFENDSLVNTEEIIQSDPSKANKNTMKKLDKELNILKIQINQLQYQQNQNDDSLLEKIESLLSLVEKYQNAIKRVNNENDSLASQLKMAIQENIVLSSTKSSKSSSPEGSDDLNCARIFVLQNDLQSIKLKYKHLNAKNKKLKDKIQELTEQHQKHLEKIKSDDYKINKLKQELNILHFEKDDLLNKSKINSSNSTLLAELKCKKEENVKLAMAFSELSDHLSSISEELSKESKSKNYLYEIVQKQAAVISQYEKLQQKAENEIQQNQETLKKSNETINNLKTEINHVSNQKTKMNDNIEERSSEVLDHIKDFLETRSIPKSISDDINTIIMQDDNPLTQIIALVDFLLYVSMIKGKKSKKINRKSEQQITRLTNYCGNLLQFIDQLANSGEMQKWIIGTKPEEDFRPLLLAQCNRIESFIRQYRDLPINHELFLDFPTRVENFLNQYDFNEREYYLILQLCTTANDVLRRYAQNLTEANHHLIQDVHELRHELKLINDESKSKIDDIQSSMNTKVKRVENQRKNLETTLNLIRKVIVETKDTNEAINQCCIIIKENTKADDSNNEYTAAILEKIKKANFDKELVVKHCLDKDKKIKIMKKKNSELLQNIDILQKQVNQMTKEKLELNETLETTYVEMTNLQKAIENQNYNIDMNNDYQNQAIEQLKNDNQRQINFLEHEIEEWKNKFQNLENSIVDEKCSIKKENKLQIKHLQDELSIQKGQNDEIRKQYDALINKYKEKYENAKKSESSIKNEFEKNSVQLKQISAELASSKIEQKMLKMKISSYEEKMKREKNLLETQYKMNLMNIETKQETLLEKQKAELESMNHDFLVLICEKFKEFFDFNQIISDKSVLNVLEKVKRELQRMSEKICFLESNSSEINTVRVLLGAKNKEPLVPIITKLTKKITSYHQAKNEIKKEKSKAEVLLSHAKTAEYQDKTMFEWEQWAKKLFSVVSDNFAAYQSSKELQYAIEEAVMAGLSQRLLIKRLEILRAEKKLLTSGLIRSSTRKSNHLSIKTILLIIDAIRRLRKVSGNVQPTVSKARANENYADNEIDNDEKPLKKYPILSTV